MWTTEDDRYLAPSPTTADSESSGVVSGLLIEQLAAGASHGLSRHAPSYQPGRSQHSEDEPVGSHVNLSAVVNTGPTMGKQKTPRLGGLLLHYWRLSRSEGARERLGPGLALRGEQYAQEKRGQQKPEGASCPSGRNSCGSHPSLIPKEGFKRQQHTCDSTNAKV